VTRPASLRYVGFESTKEGREYTLAVDGEGESRVFVLVILHAAFAARQARFQDAPDLCFAKLQRQLAAEPALVPRSRVVLTSSDLAEYRETQTKRVPERRSRAVRSGV
jgi:hypothetical protein